MMPANEVVIATVLPQRRDRAFALFTASIDAWWERTEGQEMATITLDAHGLVATLGARVETIANVTAWDPPARIELAWHGPHSRPDDQVVIEFDELDAMTRVTVRHRRTGIAPATGGALGLWWADRLRAFARSG
jgi:hypothetical protein